MDASWFGRWLLMISVLLVGCTTSPQNDDDDGGPLDPTGVMATGNDDGQTSAPTTQGNTSGPGMTSGPDGTTAATTDDDDSDDGPPPISFDLSSPDAPEFDMGCRKVDFLFVVDNSGSMSAQQTQLLASFPGFIEAIQNSLNETVDSYHVGVITSDNYSGNAPGCTTIGDLVTQTAGFGSLGQVCTPFAEGNRFATEMDDLTMAFPCMAQVGTSGSGIEQPVTATVASFDPAKTGPGGCNEGFLRDDAILVLVILTDDPPWNPDVDDAHPTTDTTGWYDAVVAAKNGDPEAMVVIGFVPWTNVTCVFQNLESPNLIGFVESFGEQGVLASICEPDFGPVFADTVETIVTTCENFDPPG